MEMTLKGTPKEFAALVLELQERQDAEPEIIPEATESQCYGSVKVATAISP